MATRPVHDPARASTATAEAMQKFHEEAVREVSSAVEKDDVVVVGMAQNPHVRKVKAALDEASVKYTYLEYGSYFSEWKKRLAIKLWTGWPTFPQVFVKGTFIGGEDLTKAALADGTLKERLAGK